MRTYNAEFQAENQKERREPRHILQIYGDTNTYYILSHSDIVIPGVSSSYIIQSSFIKSSVVSQSLQSINSTSDIGKMSFEILDINSEFTTILAAVEALDESFRARQIVYYYGYKGLDFDTADGGDYIPLQTQLVHGSLGHDGTSYKINCADIERELIKKIFTPKTTTLMSSITRTAISIPAQLVTDFSMITHTAAFSDAPSETVGYFRIENEVMRWTAKDAGTDYFTIDNVSATLSTTTAVNDTTVDIDDITGWATAGIGYIDDSTNQSEIKWTGITANSPGPSGTLTGVTGIKYAHTAGASPLAKVYYSKGRGVFNTVAVAHEVDSGITDDDRKPKIEEWIYLEMPALQLALTVMTGTIYNSSPIATLPSHWTPAISSTWIATSSFENIGTDIYDPTDDTTGLILRFEGLKTQEARSWIQKQIYRPCQVFDYILADGQIAIKRMDEPLPDSPYIRTLDDSQNIKFTNFYVDYNDVYNEFEILWSWNAVTEEFTRRLILSDEDSKTQEKEGKRLTIELYGLHGSRHTDATIIQWLDSWRSRHARAPWKGDLQIKALNTDLEIGDLVLVDTDTLRDYLGTDNDRFSRVMEIQRITSDPNNGGLSVRLFGAIERATALNLGAQSTVLAAGYYTASGTNLASQTTYFTDVGGVLHCDTNGYTMTGATSINNTAAHYYADSDLTIDADRGITFTQNTLLKVNGHLTINGYLTGVGQGIAGVAYSSTGSSGAAQAGTTGFFGVTQGGGGLTKYQWLTFNNPALSAASPNANPPRILVINNAGQLEIGQNDLRPSSGGSGQKSTFNEYAQATVYADGGDGGAGGAVLVIVCKSMSFGANGYIDTSGSEGTAGSTTAFDQVSGSNNTRGTIAGGKGSSGHPGAVWVLLDGNTATRPSNQLRAYYYTTEGPGTHLENGGHSGDLGLISSNLYNATINRNQSCWLIQQIPDNETAVEDETGLATTSSAINISASATTRNMVNTNVYEISTTAPVGDTSWKADAVYWRTQGANDWTRLGTTNGSNELLFYAGTDAGTIEFKAHPISKANIESSDYIEKTLTVSTSVTTTLGQNGKLLIGSATDYATGSGIALKDDAGTAKAHLGDPTGQHMRWTGTALEVTGSLKVNSSAGGWTIGSTSIDYTSTSSPLTGSMHLDPGNERIRIQNPAGTTYVELSLATGLKGVDSVLGTVFTVPFSGGPTFASGDITETNFAISTNAVLETATDAETNGGFRVNNSFLRTWNTTGTMTYELDFSDGSFVAGVEADEKFVKFDATAETFSVGKDVALKGADSYSDDYIYYHTYFDSIDNFETGTSGASSSVALTNTGAYLSLIVDTGGTDYAKIIRNIGFTLMYPSWSNNRRCKTRIGSFSLDSTTCEVYLGMGIHTTSGAFVFYDNGTWKGMSVNSGTSSTINFTNTPAAGSTLEIVFTTGTNVEFFVDGVSQGTVTTNLPTGVSTHTFVPFYCYIGRTTTGDAGTRNFRVGEWKYNES